MKQAERIHERISDSGKWQQIRIKDAVSLRYYRPLLSVFTRFPYIYQ